MKKDLNKEIINIEYNHLNLPTKVEFNTTDPNRQTEKYIAYTYDATGVKLQKTVQIENVSNQNFTQYDNGFIYEHTSTANPELQFFAHAEGYVEPDGNNFAYIYQYKDHLGNIRLSYKDNSGTLDIVEENNYYPFGLKHKGYNYVVNGSENNYKQYQGQEWTENLGLNWHEWKYRMSDPAIGKFISIDPLAEEYNYQSPYNFAENRVIDGFELEGLEWVDTDDGWKYEGYDYGPRPVPQNAIGIAPEGSRPVASWVSQEPRGIPFTGTVLTLYVGGPDGTVQKFTANDSGMVELPFSGTEQTGAGSSGTYAIDGHTVYGYYNRNDVVGAVEDQWGTPQNISNMINAITEFDTQTLLDNPVQIGDMRSPTNGRVNINSRSTHHANNGAFDMRILGANGGLPAGSSVQGNAFSRQNTQTFINALGNNGFTRFFISSTNGLNGSGGLRLVTDDGHDDHFHTDVD